MSTKSMMFESALSFIIQLALLSILEFPTQSTTTLIVAVYYLWRVNKKGGEKNEETIGKLPPLVSGGIWVIKVVYYPVLGEIAIWT